MFVINLPIFHLNQPKNLNPTAGTLTRNASHWQYSTMMIKSIKYHWVWLLAMLLLLAHFGCIPANQDQKLQYDHILFFVNDYALKDSLDAFFTPAEKLTTEHKSQGTIGYYYLFYNTYIELLFLADKQLQKRIKPILELIICSGGYKTSNFAQWDLECR